MIGLGISGTDTGAGKTVVACALAAACARAGLSVGVLKPVETGVPAGQKPPDATRLVQASGCTAPAAAVSPYVFPDPVAPLVAARLAGLAIELGRLDSALDAVSSGVDVALVEGAGGLLAPITADLSFDGLCARWHLGLVIVAPNRLGVLNHVRLTTAAARTARVRVRAIVLNEVGPGQRDPSAESNVQTLIELMSPLSVVGFPWLANADDIAALADAAAQSGLMAALDLPTRAPVHGRDSHEDTN